MASSSEMIWGYLVHLSYNMWSDREMDRPHLKAQPELRFDEPLWRDMLARMADAGVNMVVIDVGDAIEFSSHPEISVKGAWSHQKLSDELGKMREVGIEPIPKMNFSTAHDTWLGPYSRMISTDTYYEVCSELIAETVELFDSPRFFHLGYDEETAGHQRNYSYAVMRQHELWWHDFLFFVKQVEEAGEGNTRPWIWSDYVWNHPEEFLAQMPKSVMQSNWYYSDSFSIDRRKNDRATYVRAYAQLEEHGYDQVPTGSNHSFPENFQKTVDYCTKKIAPERLKGFMQTVWRPTQTRYRDRQLEAVDLVGKTIRNVK